jgi:hypothetical protein
MPDARKRARESAGYLWSALRLVVFSPLLVARFLARQASGTWANVVGLYRWFKFDYVLPPAVVSTLQWFFEKTPKMLGLRGTDAKWQIASAGVIVAVAFSSVLLTAGFTLAIMVAAAVFLGIGLLRLVPAFNSAYKAGRSRVPVKDDYDIPRWDRD